MQGNSPYTNVPVGAGGTANYPASQRTSGTTTGTGNYPSSQKGTSYPAGQKPGYGPEYDGTSNVKSNGFGNGGGYVQPTPVAYGPDGRPIVKKSHRMRNAIIGLLAVCCCCVAL